MNRGIVIGIIGPHEIGESIRSAVKDFPSLTPVFRLSDRLADAAVFAAELMEEADILLFSGKTPYIEALKTCAFTIPAHYIPLKGSGLYRAIHLLKNKTHLLSGLSIDTLSPEQVAGALEDLDEQTDWVKAVEYPSSGLHLKQAAEWKATAVLTGKKEVAEELEAKGIPAVWVIPTKGDIVVALERALLATEKRKSLEAQIVIGMMRITNYEGLMEASSEHDVQRQKLQLHAKILRYVESLEGHLTDLGGEHYVFVTTRGAFERVTEGFKTIPILEETKKNGQMTLHIGIGFGYSASEAGAHSRIALRQAAEYGPNQCFIVREDKSAVGPLEWSSPLVYRLSLADDVLLNMAKKAGMTAVHLERTLAKLLRTGKKQFTAQEMASILGVTSRTANRMIIQWTEAGIALAAGEEKLKTRGRPRQLYRISLE
ncbi:hypothetical protein CEF21_10800 [Bacillus sp. FJAT-42376]|uniref:hypothetical protein n=1 Tax=Bacillus sp. FJAT-42376 TaxID=2014076 RepID=UPI000F510D4F|nr:hypothetical protein [Bacillus sp. FJAT-42376]AZB42741.1 hypothetical protein CEF21_10800 [Bacillus sp. FJAT-42376]